VTRISAGALFFSSYLSVDPTCYFRYAIFLLPRRLFRGMFLYWYLLLNGRVQSPRMFLAILVCRVLFFFSTMDGDNTNTTINNNNNNNDDDDHE